MTTWVHQTWQCPKRVVCLVPYHSYICRSSTTVRVGVRVRIRVRLRVRDRVRVRVRVRVRIRVRIRVEVRVQDSCWPVHYNSLSLGCVLCSG